MKLALLLFKDVLLAFLALNFVDGRQSREFKWPSSLSLNQLKLQGKQSIVDSSHQNTTVEISSNSTHKCYLHKNYYPITIFDEELVCSNSTENICVENFLTTFSAFKSPQCRINFRERCIISYEDRANTAFFNECNTVSVRNCDKEGKEKCTTSYDTVCLSKNEGSGSGYQFPSDNSLETSEEQQCIKIPRQLCGPEACPLENQEVCESRLKTVVTQVPRERCDISPVQVCENTTMTLPGLEREEDCDTELKKHCEFVKVNETQLHICEEYEDCIPEGECTPWRLNYTNCDQLCCNEEGNSVYLRDCVKLNQDTPDRDTIRLEPCSGECCSVDNCRQWGDWVEVSTTIDSFGDCTQFRQRTCEDRPLCTEDVCTQTESISCECKMSPWGAPYRDQNDTCRHNRTCGKDFFEEPECPGCCGSICEPFWSEWSYSCDPDSPSSCLRNRTCLKCNETQECVGTSMEKNVECTLSCCSDWVESKCLPECGHGIVTVDRQCNLPDLPVHYEIPCFTCCPENCTPWGDLGDCQFYPNGTSYRKRSRTCSPARQTDTDCIESTTQEVVTPQCQWIWPDWSECDIHCLKTRTQIPSGDCCTGEPATETDTCDDCCRCTWRKIGACDADADCTQTYECVNNGNFDPDAVVCPDVRTKQEPCDPGTCSCCQCVTSDCDLKCNGIQTRTCFNNVDCRDPNAVRCPYNLVETYDCNRFECDDACQGWTDLPLDPICTNCGFGTQKSQRVCPLQDYPECKCQTKNETQCGSVTPHCDEWGDFSPCSASCGDGEHSRSRTCYDPNRSECSYEDVFTEPCVVNECCDWSEFSSCTCGYKNRTRQCSQGSTENLTEVVRCDDDTIFGSWSDWSLCPRDCSCLNKTRHRTVSNTIDDGCSREEVEFKPCDCCVWDSWSSCSCEGIQIRTSNCSETETRSCTPPAPYLCHCVWDNFSPCSSSCGPGVKTRTCRPPVPGDTFVVPLPDDPVQVATCNEDSCFCHDCTDWSSWSDCSSQCGDGVRTRQRTCNCQLFTETEMCNSTGPVGSLTSWGDFGPCNGTCGSGFKTRTRNCVDGCCTDPLQDSIACGPADSVPINCGFTEWSVDEPCTATCTDESGVITLIRQSDSPPASCGGDPCSGDTSKTIPCNGQISIQSFDSEADCYRDLDWHMIIGGSDGDKLLDTVELFNVRTRQICEMKAHLPINITEHTATSLNGIPIFCGGFSYSNSRQLRCFKFILNENRWQEIESLTQIGHRVGSVQVPDKGWYIFGGSSNASPYSQRLSSPASLWTKGPKLYNDQSANGQCAVQINTTTTIFLGGNQDPQSITAYDWNSGDYENVGRLIRPREYCVCALIKGIQGQPQIFIGGGFSKGIEIWDPDTGETNLLSEFIPPESDKDSVALNSAQIVPFNENKNLMLYGGNLGSERVDGIWKFSAATGNWEPFGNMLHPRGEHIVIPVNNIDCATFGESSRKSYLSFLFVTTVLWLALVSCLGIVSGASGQSFRHDGPSFPPYFRRRYQPRPDFGMQNVLSAVAGVGTSAIEAAQAFQVQAEPIVREGSAMLMHTMDTKIIPGVKAGLEAVGKSAANGVDKLAGSMMRYEVKEETAQAFGTLAKAIMPYPVGPDSAYPDEVPYGQDQAGGFRPYAQEEIVPVNDIPRQERDSNLPKQSTTVLAGSSPRHIEQPKLSQKQFQKNPDPQEESPDEQNPDESGGQPQTVEEALYVLGKNILGRDVNDKIFPVAKQFAASIGSIGQNLPKVEFERGKLKLMPSDSTQQKTRITDTNSISPGQQDVRDERHIGPFKDATKADTSAPPVCTTPEGETGHCMGIQNCPILLANLDRLRKSVCFQSLFSIGVCCPDLGLTIADFGSLLFGNNSKPDQTPAIVTDNKINNPTTKIPSLADLSTTTPRPSPFSDFQPGKVPGTNFDCGSSKIPQARIVGGNITYEGQYPWMVAIYLHGNGKREFWCGGALVSDVHVVTAAHCTKDAKKKPFLPTQFTVRVGEWDLNDKDDYTHEITVQEISAHPDFRANGFYNDIAVFKLNEPVKFNEHIQPICLPTGSLLGRDLTNAFPVALGWGTTYYGGEEVNELRAVALPVWTNQDCDNAYFQPITEVFLCAGFADGGKDACQGDSGGPLMLYDEKANQWTLVGVVSFGNRCAEPGFPGVYTRLTHFMPWVLANLT